STVTNYLRLLKLDPILQTGIRDGFISMGHGRAMINIENTEDQLAIYEKILREKLSVRQTEDLVKNLKSGAVAKPKRKTVPTFVKQSVKEISEYFGHKINVSVTSSGKGKISIPFHSEEDFNRIKNLLK
ncbi:MAG: ParB/RepB/Spo0J family partition protein, partial [Polaribacter sp.]